MNHAMKLLAVLMILCLCCAQAEEAAMNEIWSHLQQEAAQDGVDLSGIRAMNPSTYSVIANAEWLKYEFPLDDPASAGVQIPFEQPLPEYSVWQMFSPELAEFNAIEETEARYEYPDY